MIAILAFRQEFIQKQAEGRVGFIEFMDFLSNIPTTLLPFAILAYFYNANNLKWMEERKQLAEAVLAERKELAEAVLSERREWLAERREMIERQFLTLDRVTTELASTRNENHAMRGKLTDFLLRLENHFFGPPRRPDGQ